MVVAVILDVSAELRVAEKVCKGLKQLIDDSAHAQVLRNLICVPARNKANFGGFTRRSVEGEFHLKKYLSLFYTLVIRNRFVWIIFYSGVGF